MLLIGLTGGIGSGKTTVADLFAELGIPVIDTDRIAANLLEPKSSVTETVIEHFGPSILNEYHEIDRRKLRAIIFTNIAERTWLEKLLHPLIRVQVDKQLLKLNAAYCIIVVPLLIETKSYDLIDRILIVDTPELLQIQRAMARDDSSETQIAKIIDAQASRQQRLYVADDVIVNDSNLNSLKRQVNKLHQFYLSLTNEKNKLGQTH